MTHSTILAIETSCDETAAAVIENGRTIRSNVVATQIDLHRRYGGVFPEVASRQHVLSIQPVIQQALDEASISDVQKLDAIAVTHGPGLAGSLLVGVNAAKGLSFASGVPLLPINHLEGHIYSNWINSGRKISVDRADEFLENEFPQVILIVSGGHTEIILMTDHGSYQRLGGTIDDAAGEAFDKVARLLDLGFPGGPAIQKTAQSRASSPGDPTRFDLPRALRNRAEHRFNFSFSGLKTAVLNLTRKLEENGEDLSEPQLLADLAASFQAAVADILVLKLADAAEEYEAKQVCICGGVSANAALREAAQTRFAALDIPLYTPPLFLCTDNAAMIGSAAYYRFWGMNGEDPLLPNKLGVDVFANLPLAAVTIDC